MTGVRMTIVRYVSDDPQPGLVEVRLVDAHGRAWLFHEKTAVVSAEPLWADSAYPREVIVRVRVAARTADARGHGLARVHVHRLCPVGDHPPDGLYEVPADALGTADRTA